MIISGAPIGSQKALALGLIDEIVPEIKKGVVKFAKKITQGVVKDEYLHLNYGQEWLKENLATCKQELIEANKVNLPLIKKMLDQVAKDESVLAMDREELMEEFMIAYQDTLLEIGLDNREIARMAMAAIV